MTELKRLSFDEYLKELDRQDKRLQEQVVLLDHQIYKRIPGTQNSYRKDPLNTNILTKCHSHVYAKLSGEGATLFRQHGRQRTQQLKRHGNFQDHAEFFRNRGYKIPESLDFAGLDRDKYEIFLLE